VSSHAHRVGVATTHRNLLPIEMGTTVIIHLTDEQAAELESMAEETRVSVAKAAEATISRDIAA